MVNAVTALGVFLFILGFIVAAAALSAYLNIMTPAHADTSGNIFDQTMDILHNFVVDVVAMFVGAVMMALGVWLVRLGVSNPSD